MAKWTNDSVLDAAYWSSVGVYNGSFKQDNGNVGSFSIVPADGSGILKQQSAKNLGGLVTSITVLVMENEDWIMLEKYDAYVLSERYIPNIRIYKQENSDKGIIA